MDFYRGFVTGGDSGFVLDVDSGFVLDVDSGFVFENGARLDFSGGERIDFGPGSTDYLSIGDNGLCLGGSDCIKSFADGGAEKLEAWVDRTFQVGKYMTVEACEAEKKNGGTDSLGFLASMILGAFIVWVMVSRR